MKTPPREVPSWDEYFLNMCKDVAKRSKDPSTQHGAVIVDEKHGLVSTGYNGGCRHIPDELLDWGRPAKYEWGVIHAEENALWFAKRDLDGCTMYITGPPCSKCMLRIAHLGIVRVVYGDQQSHCIDADDWNTTLMIVGFACISLENKRF